MAARKRRAARAAPRKRERGTTSLPCPECGGKSDVLRTKRPEEGAVRRERRCLECGYRFGSLEMAGEAAG